VSAAASVYGAKKQSKAAKDSGDQQLAGIREQIAFERERDAEMRRQWDAEQARRAPYREFADSLLRQQAGQFGMPVAPRQPEQPPAGLAGLAGAPPRSMQGQIPDALSGLRRRAAVRPQVDPARRANTLGALVRY
jgi:hypothetical protein